MRSITPRLHRFVADGISAGDGLNAAPGAVIYKLALGFQDSDVDVIAESDVDLEGDGAILHLTAGTKVHPVALLSAFDGQRTYAYYLVQADRSLSKFMRVNRYFAIADDGAVLDHSLRKWGDYSGITGAYSLYGVTEPVEKAAGSLRLDHHVAAGTVECRISVVYLGVQQGTASFKVIWSKPDGSVINSKSSEFTTDTSSVALPGAIVNVQRMDGSAFRGTVAKLEDAHCN